MKKENAFFRRMLVIVMVLALLFSAVPMIRGTAALAATKKVKLNRTQATLTVGTSLLLRVENKPKAKKVQWSSSYKHVAVVSNKGKVTAKNAGFAKITAKVGNKKYICKVTVEGGAISEPDTKPVISEEALNQSEVAALKKLIAEQKELGNIMSADITDTKYYIWNDDGSLESMSAMLAGTVSLQDFPALVSLDAGVYIDDEYEESYDKGKLKALDVTKNLALEAFFCSGNKLKVLDVTKNPVLLMLYCGDNMLTTLNIKKNLALFNLQCERNQLKKLNVTKHSALRYLYCSGNLLTTLDVTKNSELMELYCDNNKLTTLNVKKNPNLDILHCEGNKIKTLNLTKNQLLEEFKCDDTVKVVR